MCGRYAVFLEEENQEMRMIINEINERYRDDAHKMKTGEIFPTNTAAVITADSKNNKVANLFKWGFPGFTQTGGVIINARSESLVEKPIFGKILQSNRCLIPASGFYEWKPSDSKKEKYLIRASGNPLIYMAGLYNTFTDKDGNPNTYFVIITTNANEQMTEIHNRMPAIIRNDKKDSWIDKNKNVSEIINILTPYKDRLIFEHSA